MALVIGKYDEDKQKEGVWVKYDESDLLIASAQSTKFSKLLNRLQMKNERAIKKDPSVANKVYIEAMAEAMLLDWKNVVDVEGNEVPYTVEMSVAALTGDPDLREFVTNTAVDNELYTKELVKAKAKK